MNVSGNDVKVLGKVVSIAVDNIVADAEQVFDKNANLNQETINRNMTNAINQAVADVSSINTMVGSLEDAIDDKLNISDYQTYATQMREDIMLKISEVEDEKQDVLTFDNVPTANSNNPVKSGGIKTAIDDAVNGLKTNFTTEDIKIVYNDQQYANIYGNDDALRFVVSAPDFFISSTSGTTISSNGAISIVSHGEDGVLLNADNGGTTISSSATTTIIGDEEIGISSDSAININADEEINLNAPSVKVNGKNAEVAIDKITSMYPTDNLARISEPGIYFTGISSTLLPDPQNDGTSFLMLVYNVSEPRTPVVNIHQLLIGYRGTMYKRVIQYTQGHDVDWDNASAFTVVS